MQNFRRWLAAVALVLFGVAGSTNAGDFVLSNNTGASSTVWFISGEPSLVINGFDLQALGVNRPVELDQISIDVVTPVPGASIQAVVYEDANGGSPQDATLAGSTTVTINQSGVFTATFNPPLTITQPVIWVGFYLPVDFEFRADTSGTSVLTYWAWTPGTTFDVTDLGSAQVFGPADGTAPVNIDMGGVARITAELITDGQTPQPTTPGSNGTVDASLDRLVTDEQGRIIQVVGDSNVSLAPLATYDGGCGFLYFDRRDVIVNFNGAVELDCKLIPDTYSPPTPEGYFRLDDQVHDVTVFGIVSPGTNRMPYPITHCLEVQSASRDRAVLGLAWGAPREWEILPTVRYGNVLCADMNYAGSIAAFVPN
jgi:hypothetical protein